MLSYLPTCTYLFSLSSCHIDLSLLSSTFVHDVMFSSLFDVLFQEPSNRFSFSPFLSYIHIRSYSHCIHSSQILLYQMLFSAVSIVIQLLLLFLFHCDVKKQIKTNLNTS
jgi:hypothetical protein